ncbi:MAG: hypothetical protein Q9160_002611 [Pyrenula sp. 1 TL-2023]
MARISIPLDAITSRFNISDKFQSVRSQSIATRFSNLKPISEFLDLKRLSKPANFSEVQTRVNYNLSHFSSNYLVVFLMLSIYSLLTNFTLLFVLILAIGGTYGIGKLEGRDLDIGVLRATTSQLYTALLTYRECFFRGGGLGGRPRTPYDVPRWGRPPGARLGKNKNRGWGRQSSWDDEGRFEEIEDSDEDGLHGVELDTSGFSQKRYVSDELHFTGIDMASSNARRRRHSDGDDSYSEGSDDSSVRRSKGKPRQMQLMLREKEDYLVERALDRIRRAEQLGKSDVQLSQQEIDALERQRKLANVTNAPRGKKGVASKPTASKTRGGKAASKALPQKAIESRPRSKSNARSTSNPQQPPPYPVLPGDSQAGPTVMVPYAGPGYYDPQPRPSSSSSRKSSKKSSSQSLYQQQAYPQPYLGYPQPYPPGRYHGVPESSFSGSAPPLPRPDPADPNWAPRSRSSSSLVPNPAEQRQYGYAPYHGSGGPDIDPRMPPPNRRIASGPPVVYQHQSQLPPQSSYYHAPVALRPEDHGGPQTDTSEEASSSSEDEDDDDDGEYQGVQVDVVERSTGYDVRTRESGSGPKTRSSGRTRRGRGKK